MKQFTPILLLVASIGLFFLVINPQYKNVTDLRAQSQQYDDAIDRAKSVVAKRDQLLATANSLSADNVKRLQKLLPDKVDTIQLIIDINDVASRRYSSSIKDIKVSTDTAKQTTVGVDTKPYSSVLMGFTVALTYDQFVQFLKDMEQSLHLVDVAAVSFKPTDTSSVYQYSITFKTYFLK